MSGQLRIERLEAVYRIDDGSDETVTESGKTAFRFVMIGRRPTRPLAPTC